MKHKRINEYGYIEKRIMKPKRIKSPVWRNWWLIKCRKHIDRNNKKTIRTDELNIGILSLPSRYIGKRIRIKIEVIGDETNEKTNG